jgi:hypothetical protein
MVLDVRPRAIEPSHNLLKLPKRDTMMSTFQPV